MGLATGKSQKNKSKCKSDVNPFFAFENETYEKNNVPVKNVGHPLASLLTKNRSFSGKRLDLSDKMK